MAGTVEGVFHAVISVSDMTEGLRYFRDLLGLQVTFDDYHEPAAIAGLFGFADPVLHSAVVSCPDGSEIEIVEWEKPRGRPAVERSIPDAGVLSVNLRVRGIEDLVDRLDAGGYGSSSGIVPQALPDGGILKVAVCRGPDGVTLILVELPPGRASLAG